MYVGSRSSGSLWDAITAQCSSVELLEVKRIIGESLVEQMCELQAEVRWALIKHSIAIGVCSEVSTFLDFWTGKM